MLVAFCPITLGVAFVGKLRMLQFMHIIRRVPAGTPLKKHFHWNAFWKGQPVRVTPLQFDSPWNGEWHHGNNSKKRRALAQCLRWGSHAAKLHTAENSTEPKLWAIRARERETQRVIQRDEELLRAKQCLSSPEFHAPFPFLRIALVSFTTHDPAITKINKYKAPSLHFFV